MSQMASSGLRAAQTREKAGDLEQANEIYRTLYRPDAPDLQVLVAWARLRRRMGDLANAIAMLQQATRLGDRKALIPLATALIDAGQYQPATAALRQAKEVGLAGADLELQQGRLAEASGLLEQAAGHYRAASRTDPRHEEARIFHGRVLLRLGRLDEAEQAYTALLKRHPGNLTALSDLGWLRGNQRRFREALACYDQLEAAGVEIAHELSQLALGFMHICDWSMRAPLRDRLAKRCARAEPCLVEPYAMLASTDDPACHRLMATCIAGAVRRQIARVDKPASRPIRHDKLRIGYLSADFHQHATTLLLAGVIEAHDRARFEVIAYDYSPEDGTAARSRMVSAFDRFVRIHQETASETAHRIAADEIDILIDLNGYTEHSRPEIAALRPAPVQVSFLGYIATWGGDWIDYVIADDVVLPLSEQADWAEQIVHMPVSYYPSDRSRPSPVPDCDRATQGLPEDGFVFACLNNPFKHSPEVFAIWMRLLREIEGGVLWLYEGNPFVAENLRRAAGQAGIDPERLVFAKPVALDEHIRRHACIDLFLDTTPYGAHTTGVDALWAGIPLITCPGRSFASRVGASLLRAVGLEELIAESLDSYAELALALARDRPRLAALRAHLQAVRYTAPLFDAACFARDLEKAYIVMAERHREGKTPAPLLVEGTRAAAA